LKTPGTQWIAATDTVNSALASTQSGIAVQPGAAQSLTMTAIPTPGIAGVTATFRVTAYDAVGNVATGYTGTVALTTTLARAQLPASYTFTAADAGRHTFSLTVLGAGTGRVMVTDRANVNLSVMQTGIVIQPAAALVVGGDPNPDTARVAHSLAVTAYD